MSNHWEYKALLLKMMRPEDFNRIVHVQKAMPGTGWSLDRGYGRKALEFFGLKLNNRNMQALANACVRVEIEAQEQLRGTTS